MNLVQRVQDILLRPKETWPAIEQEPADTATLYKDYIVLLAAIPAVAGLVGMSVFGVGGFGMRMRMPFMSSLAHAVVQYVLTLAMVFVLALIVDALAPSFGGTKRQINALKLVAYSMTAGFVGGIFALFPALGVLGLLAALYAIYLLYTGLPALMKCPPDKAGAYTAVVVVCGIVAGLLVAAISAAVMPSRMSAYGGLQRDGNVTISTPKGEVSIDTAKLDAMAKRMEEAGKKIEAAQRSGDTAAVGKATQEMLGAMTGSSGEPLDPQALKALLPDGVGDLKRESIEAQGNQAMGLAGSSAKASYAAGDRQLRLSVTDLGGLGGLANIAGWAGTTLDRETAEGVERIYKSGDRTVRESARKDGSQSEYTVILANGVIVEGRGQRVDAGALKAAVEGLDLAKLEAMKRPHKS
jgi:hypothetical protein